MFKSPRFHTLLLLASLTAPSTAFAHPILETMGMGLNPFTGRVLSTGAEASYFAPSLLPHIEQGISIGFVLLSDDLNTKLKARDSSADISDAITTSSVTDSTVNGVYRPAAKPTRLLSPRQDEDGGQMRSYLSIGIAKQLVCDRLVLGLLALVPTSSFQEQSAFYPDEREQYFTNSLRHELYGDRLGMMSVVFALGGKATNWLSWGAGLTLGLSTGTSNPVYMPDAGRQEMLLLSNHTEVDTAFSPHLSLTFTPSQSFQLTTSWHGEAKSTTSGENVIRFRTTDENQPDTLTTQAFKFTNGYEPMTIGLAGAYTLNVDSERRWKFAGEVKWRQWSDYINRVSESPVDEWSDTFSLAIGGRYETGKTAFSFDAGYFPSPIPDQIGAENYVDEDRIGFAAGLESEISIFGTKLRGQIGVQVHRLLERDTSKRSDARNSVRDEFPDDAYNRITQQPIPEAEGFQTNNPGWPGWTSSGWILGAGVNLKIGL